MLAGLLLCLAGCSSGSDAPQVAERAEPPAAATPTTPTTPAPPPPPPNILFILTDDLGAEASSLYPDLAGSAGQAPMPNIEALAANGLVFDHAWASPVCSPTRATIVSGLYGHRTGVTYVGDVLPTATTTSIFNRIAAASPAAYQMAVFGKWHLGTTTQHLRDHGVPEFRGILDGLVSDYFNWSYTDLNDTVTPTAQYATSAITDFAIDYISGLRSRSDAPWFIYLAYTAPHGTSAFTGFQVPPTDLHSVDVGGLAPGAIQDSIPVYQSMIQAVDTEIGRLLDAIGPEGSPERDNTVVIFMGDNGTPAPVKDPTAGIRGSKSSVFEGGVRVPLMISGAGVTRRGEREDALVVSTDLYATIAALSGIDLNRIGDSVSLLPLLSDAASVGGRELAFTEMCLGSGYYAIRNERYKLSQSAGTWAFYDLDSDATEANNLYTDAAVAAERTLLEAELGSIEQSAIDGCFQ